MLAVADAPRVIGHKEHTVHNQTNNVSNHDVVREGAMATLVGKHPEPCAHTPLAHPVEGPQHIGERVGDRGVVDEGAEVVEEGSDSKVDKEVAKRRDQGTLKASSRNGFLFSQH